jgi:hypothetical protein
MLPSKLKNFTVFNDGRNYIGEVAEVTLPKLAMKGEAYRGAGMLSELDADLGIEKLEMEHSYGGMVVGVLRQMGLTRVDGAQLRFVGAYQSDTAGGITAAELVVRGRHVEIDPGKAKAGDDTEWKVKSTLSYLKWTVAGTVEVEIDVMAPMYKIGGVDRMAEIRELIGGSGASPAGGAGGLLGGMSGSLNIGGLGSVGVGGSGLSVGGGGFGINLDF